MDTRLTKIRLALMLKETFFTSIMFRKDFVEEEGLGTAATDGYKISYDPKWLLALIDDEIKFVLLHEVMHIVLSHVYRQKDFPRKNLYAAACDYVVNGLLCKSGYKGWMPKEGLIDPKYDGMSTEQVYKLLDEQYPEQNCPSCGGTGSNCDDCGGTGRKGEAAVDLPEGWDFGGMAEPKNEDGTPKSPAELKQAEAETRLAVRQAAAQAKKRGHLPAGLESIIEATCNPKQNYKEVLDRFVSRISKSNYSYERPNKRYMQMGIVAPSRYSRDIGDIVVAIDTSGSVNSDELNQFASELSSILENFKVTVHLCYCDTRCHDGGEFTNDDLPLQLTAKGGGGTSFDEIPKWVEKKEIDPACLLYFTDGYSSYSGDGPLEYPVLWAVDSERGLEYVPDFFESIHIF